MLNEILISKPDFRTNILAAETLYIGIIFFLGISEQRELLDIRVSQRFVSFRDLDGYYIAHKDEMPRLAGLAYLDRGDIDGAAECFSSPNMDGENHVWSVKIQTDEQRRRAQENGVKIHTAYGESIYRSRKEQFMDYAVAVKNGLEWNHDRAMYGLLNNERSI